MVSNVNLFTAIVVVVILMIVTYLALIPTPQSIWKIENRRIYNLHLPPSSLKHKDRIPNFGFETMASISRLSVDAEITNFSHSPAGNTMLKDTLSSTGRRNDSKEVANAYHNEYAATEELTEQRFSRDDPQVENSNHGNYNQTTKQPMIQVTNADFRNESLWKNRSMEKSRPEDGVISRRTSSKVELPNLVGYDHNNATATINTPMDSDINPPSWQYPVSIWSNKTLCSDNVCSQYLSRDDKVRYYSCQVRSKSRTTPKDGTCHFIDGSHRPSVALVSYPGSGNTWVRGILEVATGICTGAIYCDASLRSQSFIGEGLQSGSVLVVKTHGSAAMWLGSHLRRSKRKAYFGSAIFIVRNPLNALVAEWNRKVANKFRGRTVSFESHTKSAGKEWFDGFQISIKSPTSGGKCMLKRQLYSGLFTLNEAASFGNNKHWRSYVHGEINRWVTMLRNWVVSGKNHPVLLVKYENLKDNMLSEVKRMLRFLKVDFSDKEVESRVAAGFNAFQRKHSGRDFDPYTPELRHYVQSKVNASVHFLEAHNLGHLIQIQDYVS